LRTLPDRRGDAMQSPRWGVLSLEPMRQTPRAGRRLAGLRRRSKSSPDGDKARLRGVCRRG